MKQFALQINPEDVPEVKKLMEGLGYKLDMERLKPLDGIDYLFLITCYHGEYDIYNCTKELLSYQNEITLSDLREMTKEDCHDQ